MTSNGRFAVDTQREVYLRGLSGRPPQIPTRFVELEAAAQQRMSAQALAYMAGGAGLERTMQANRGAFDRFRIAPRVLRDEHRCFDATRSEIPVPEEEAGDRLGQARGNAAAGY